MKVVVTRPLPEAGLEALRAAHAVHVHDFGAQKVTEDDLIGLARDAHALLTLLTDPVTARVFDGCPELKVVAQYAVGYDNIDVEAARRRGVVVTHTPGVLTDATADLAFALLLALARRIPAADRYVRDGRFVRWETDVMLGPELRGKTLGIVGMGRIGQAVAQRARGFGMDVVYHNRRPLDAAAEATLGARRVTFDALLAASDVVSLHCALNADSRHLFDAEAFRRMKPTALLVNTARGPVVDEAALVDALAAGEIAGAGLDVFETEPLPADHPLWTMENAILTPHVAAASPRIAERHLETLLENIRRFVAGQDPVTLVDKRKWY